MAKRVFKADLSQKGMLSLQRQLRNYRDVTLPQKCKELVLRLSQIGVNTAKIHVGESPLGKYVELKTDLIPGKSGCIAFVIATGQSMESEGREPFNTLLAIEFGSGIYHNQQANPKSEKLGYGVGTFPGQIHAFEEGWYYWDEKSQEWRYTHGVKATMPMHNASVKIIESVRKIALDVFSS